MKIQINNNSRLPKKIEIAVDGTTMAIINIRKKHSGDLIVSLQPIENVSWGTGGAIETETALLDSDDI